MPLMTVKEWQQHTTKTLTDRKNPLVTDIDILLGEYHKVGKTDVQILKLVILIRRYCREWLSEKDEKDGSFRRKYVDILLKETTAELKTPQMKQAIQQMIAGKQTPGQQIQSKQMVEHPIELVQPRATVKEKWDLKADIKLSRVSAPQTESSWKQHHIGTPMDQADISDVLDHIQDQQKKDQLQRSLDYLQKKERHKYVLARWPDRTLHRGGSGSPYSSQGKNMYAIDDMQKIYTAAPKKYGEFHHTSFLSGRPVLCAGEIELQQGTIKYIDNGSGHYKPTTQHLLACVKLLESKYQVDLVQVSIEDHDPGNQGPEWKHAFHFLKNGGKRPRPLPAPPPSIGS